MKTFIASAFVLLICTAALLSTTEVSADRPMFLHCKCLQTYSKQPIPAEKILSLRVIPEGPQCKNTEIIATMKKGMVCLNPTKDWVISLKKDLSQRKALESTTEGKPLNLLCKCPQMHSETTIPIEKILSLRVIPAGPHCKNEEIITTMKNEQKCLDPTKDWVISLKEEFFKSKTTASPNALLSTTEGEPEHLNLLCVCPQMHSEPPIPAETILSLRVIPVGPHCKNEEIIATMKNEQWCLDPTKNWVISHKDKLIDDSSKLQPVSPSLIQTEVVLSTTSFTRETEGTFCVKQ